MATQGFYDFVPTLQQLFQNGILVRELQEGLDSDLAFRRQATEETIPGHIGSTITIPKKGRKGPVTTPLDNTMLTTNLDNGMTPSNAPAESYSLTMNEWGDTQNADLIGNEAANTNLVLGFSRDNGVQAAQSMERLAKITLHAAYDTGNTWIRTDLNPATTTRCPVDDARGFLSQKVFGVDTAVSVANPLTVYEVATSNNGVTQSFQVTGFIPDTPSISLYPGSQDDAFGNTITDGQSGQLVIQAIGGGPVGSVPVAGDALIAANAPKIVRPFNKPSYNMLASGDSATLGLLLDAITRLKANNVPPMSDGMYHFIHDPSVQRQLFADQQFLVAYASRYKSEEYQKAQIFELLGILFIPTTEAYQQPPTPALGVNVPIRRSMLMGAGAIIQGNFAGLDTYLNQQGLNPIGGVMMVNNVAQIIAPPIDRMLRVLRMSWTWIGNFVCQTDATATPNIIPTASNATFKRAVCIETAG